MRSLLRNRLPFELVATGQRLLLLLTIDYRHAHHYAQRLHLLGK